MPARHLASIAILTLACTTHVVAQVTDDSQVARQVPATTSEAVSPRAPGTGSAKTVLVPFGPYITGIGTACGGADASQPGLGLVTLGWSTKAGSDSVAVDFTVPSGPPWTITDVKWLAYQIGAATTGSITALNLNLWNTDPTGLVPGGEWQTGGNQFTSMTWTGVFRVSSSSPGDCSRAIMSVRGAGAWIPSLPTGTYWIETQCSGLLTNGPWSPVEVPASSTANGLQSTSGGVFQLIVDGGGPGFVTDGGPAQDFLFQLEGMSGGGGVSTFCTSKASSLPGCTPIFTTSAATASKAGAPATALTAVPVPGGPGLPGILIYAKTPPSAPVATSFGFLCLSNFARAGAFPSNPGGSAGTCTGLYNWNASAIAAGTASIVVGDKLRIQAWYRDPGFAPPGNANFTHGLDGITIVP